MNLDKYVERCLFLEEMLEDSEGPSEVTLVDLRPPLWLRWRRERLEERAELCRELEKEVVDIRETDKGRVEPCHAPRTTLELRTQCLREVD